MLPFEKLMEDLRDSLLSGDRIPDPVRDTLGLLCEKLSGSSRSTVKRCKERCVEEAIQLLRKVPDPVLRGLQDSSLRLLVQLLIALQLQMVNISTACRKVDQMLQQLAKVNLHLVQGETRECLCALVETEQPLSFEDLQKACMFLEDSAFGQEAWRELHPSFVNKISQLFPRLLQQESLRDGPTGYIAVKMCLQIFQLLPTKVAPVVWEKNSSPALQNILKALIDIILGQSRNRDTRLLAGTAVAMLINTAPEGGPGGAAAWSVLQVCHEESRLLEVGTLQVNCSCGREKDGVERLALSRGLLTCCQPHILLSPHPDAVERCVLLDGLFPLIRALCEEKMDRPYFVFEVLTLWLKKVRECIPTIWKKTSARLLSDHSSLQQQLIHIIWSNGESPVDGVPELVRGAFCLLLELYQMDCKQFGDAKKSLYLTLLRRIIRLPWQSRVKYHRLCALIPYLGTEMVMDQYADVSGHILKCLSTNHLSPCGSELYKCLIQQQRRELCDKSPRASDDESYLAGHWAKRWRPVLLEGLTSDGSFLQNNTSVHLLPCTFQVFPASVEPLLASLDPFTPGHLRAWACVTSSYRATTGGSPWALQGGSTLETLRLALGSADDKVRLAALNLLCCSPKAKDTPSSRELSLMRAFIPQNMNCESSSFRQHFQAGVKKFLVRVRDSCLAQVRRQKGKCDHLIGSENGQEILDRGIDFVEWLSQLPYHNLAPGHCYQRKKTALLLLSAVLETCTDTWSPDRRKGQPPVNMGSLIDSARERGQWNFFLRTKQLVLICCLEDSTNEIRELSAELLLRFFPAGFPADIAAVLLSRTKQLLRSPRVPRAQMGALVLKVLLQKSRQRSEEGDSKSDSCGSDTKVSAFISFLISELEEHYLAAKADMMLAARSKPIHGVLVALQRCLLEAPRGICHLLSRALTSEILGLLENTSLLLLRVLHRDREPAAAMDAPPSFCDMGNAISALIANASGGNGGDDEECVLLSEEHSLVLTCCWVSLKEIGIFLGSLVRKILTESEPDGGLLTKEDLTRISKIFRNILLKCRHWGAVEGCCVGFTKFCASLLSSSDPELREIPAHMLKQALQVVQSPSTTSVTRRAAGLPMLILCVLSAEEASKTRPLLARSVQTLLDTAGAPLPDSWDQTLDLPQVCAVHTLQALVRGSPLAAAVLQFAPAVAVLSLTLLSSPCWAMRNAALQLYSSLCSRMLGQRYDSEEGVPRCGMSPPAFFLHYPALQHFLLSELRGAAGDLRGPPEEARLRLQPSLYPILTLLAQLQPGIQDSTETLADFLPPLLQLSASPIYSVRAMASKALVAMSPPSEYMRILVKLTSQLPAAQERCCHNALHGQLLQIGAVLGRALAEDRCSPADLAEVLNAVQASLWLATDAQRCPLVKAAYLSVADSLRGFCCRSYLSELRDVLMCELGSPQRGFQVGSSTFRQQAIQFLCADQRWGRIIWEGFSDIGPDLRLPLVSWVLDTQPSQLTSLRELIQSALQSHLREALLSPAVEYRRTYLDAFLAVTAVGDSLPLESLPPSARLEDSVLLECLDLLLSDLEDRRGGPDFQSQALCVASFLLPGLSDPRSQMGLIRRWCVVLESRRSPDAPEVLRTACAEALRAAGVPLMSRFPREVDSLAPVRIRLINTGLHLLQDQSQPVRRRAAFFVSVLQHVGTGRRGIVYAVQVNQALQLLLNLLLEEFYDAPGALEVLLDHLPPSDLRSVLEEASGTGCASLYEQDDANVFAEPTVMSACVLPRLLLMAAKASECPALAEAQRAWAEKNTVQVLDGLAACKELRPGETLTPAWLSLLTDPGFHSALCGLLARAAFLDRLSQTSADTKQPCEPSALQDSVREVCALLARNGVRTPSAVTAAAGGDM